LVEIGQVTADLDAAAVHDSGRELTEYERPARKDANWASTDCDFSITSVQIVDLFEYYCSCR